MADINAQAGLDSLYLSDICISHLTIAQLRLGAHGQIIGNMPYSLSIDGDTGPC